MSVQRQQRALSLGQAAERLPRHVAPTDTKTPSVGYTGKPAAQIAAEHSEWRDNQPIATSCGFCGWRFDGTAAEGRVEARTHRESEHPEATVRRARGRRRVTLRRDQQDAGTRSQIKLAAAEANRVRAEREEADRLVKVPAWPPARGVGVIAGQLDIFHQPQPEPVEVDVPAARTWSQLTELPGETWQEIFEKKDAT